MNVRLRRNMKRSGRLFYRAMMTKKWWLLVLSTSLLFMMGGCAAVLMTTAYYNLDSLKNMKFATTLYDHKGKPIVPLGDTKRDYVSLKKIKSAELIEKAFISVEDERFYQHNGADLKGIARALAVDILTFSPKEGASTITQQVARNVILNENEKTMLRKVNEIAIAYNLERKYTKKQILESYLNYIYLGNEVRGIQMASKIYFGKDLTKTELEPYEAALLAGLPKAPEGYNPYINPDRAKQRRNVVLAKMAEKKIITEEEKEKYQERGLGVNKKYLQKHKGDNRFQAYKDYLMKEAEERYGLDAQKLVNGGYKVYTGMNKKAQLSLEQALQNDTFYQGHEKLDSGATMVDPKTGRIAAIGGGRQYMRGFENRALAHIQPGSSIKPLTVYGPAVQEKGYNENSPVSDAPYTYRGWSPKNMDRTYHGTLPLKEVAAKSLNVATARLLTQVVGVDTAFSYAEKLGLNLDERDKSPAPLALGGLTKGVSTLQMAQAYSSFPNKGKYTEAHAIKKIVDADGNVVEPKEEVAKKKKVFSPQAAFTMNKTLKHVVTSGSGRNAQLADGRDIAGKTGTTQNSREAWFVGYSQEYVMATVVFNQNGSGVDLTGGEYPARIFRKVMTDTLRGTKVSRFKAPGGDGSSGGGWKQFFGDDEPEQPEEPEQQEPEQWTPPTEDPGNQGDSNPGNQNGNPGNQDGNPDNGDQSDPPGNDNQGGPGTDDQGGGPDPGNQDGNDDQGSTGDQLPPPPDTGEDGG
ncbi:PBP1A family penicillin-binding protein [Salinithrix halophila]|uniref:PBP1A family penicillin-binding protein n=1 Tax=Salinithrix halophila TaxID=1485204 RepID=A0ABV8JHB2_9BACL